MFSLCGKGGLAWGARSGRFVVADCNLSGGRLVSVMTNTLSTTDEPLAHFGYARHRKRAAEARGRAVRADADRDPARPERPVASRGSLDRLHAKLAVVDGRRLFIGRR